MTSNDWDPTNHRYTAMQPFSDDVSIWAMKECVEWVIRAWVGWNEWVGWVVWQAK